MSQAKPDRSRTLRALLAKAESWLGEKRVDSPRLSAQLLFAKALGLDRLGLFLDLDRPLTEAEMAAARELLLRRGKGEPVAYILGEREFFGLPFFVTPATLIPRPETEQIIEELLHMQTDLPEVPRLLDLGTGSGCLAVTAAVRLPGARVTAVDVSAEAIEVARRNALRHKVADRVEFVHADVREIVRDAAIEPAAYDVVMANPPYVSRSEMAELSREVADFEPAGALTPPENGGETGLELIGPFMELAASTLKPGGRLLMEIGWKQGEDVLRLAETSGQWTRASVLRDLSGHDRVTSAYRA